MRLRSPSRTLCAVAVLGAALSLSRPARAAGDDALKAAVDAYEAGHYAKAALGFYDVSENSGNAEAGYRAEYFLALTLFKMGLPQSALTYDHVIIEQGPKHPYYTEAVENTLDVMDAVGDKSLIPSMLDREYNDSFAKLPKAVIDRVNFIVALWSYSQRRWEDAKSFLDAVPQDSAVYARARYLKGLDLARQALVPDAPKPMELDRQAVLMFRSVLALQNHGKVTYSDLDDLKQLAQLGLARVVYAEGGYLYGHGQDPQGRFGQAFDEYNKVPRFSRHWQDALFEGAYAAFMNDEPGKALGLLQTLHAPVASEQLVPESWLLQSLIYYNRCLFDESKAAIKKMQSTYTPIHDQIDALLQAKREPDFYFKLVQDGSDGGTRMPAMVRNDLLVDETLRGRRNYILELGLELAKLKQVQEWKGSDLLQVLSDAVSQQRNLNIQIAGKTVIYELRVIKNQLEDLDGQAEIVKFEMAKREKDLLEAGYDQESVLKKQKLYRPAMPPKGIEYWPFQGEFWPDELGYYRYTLKNACPPDEQASQSQ